MSYDYRYRRTTTNRPGNRRYVPPPPPSRGSSSHHTFFGFWFPVVVTSTLALGGLAAWIWSERSEHDEDDYPQDKPPRPQTGVGPGYPTQGSQPYPGAPPPGQQYQGPPPGQAGPAPPPPPGGEASSYYNTTTTTESRAVNVEQSQSQQDESTWYGRMTGAIKRTPSPQNLFDSATRQVTAGMAAAGAALGSIIETGEESDQQYDDRQTKRKSERRRDRTEEREGFSDHERWSEEADEKLRVGVVEAESERRADNARSVRDEKGKSRAKRAVAVVVSADTRSDFYEDQDAGYTTEHASILSHLPSQHDSDTTDLFVLIYAPGLKSLPPLDYQPSIAGSASPQMHTPAATPGSELQSMSPRVDAADRQPTGASAQFDALYQQALSLVSNPAQILPFTTSDGYVSILKHLTPSVVYVSDTLSGDDGEYIEKLKGWVGHTILVAGDEGHGGLADTETEDEGNDDKARSKWYESSSFVGLGKEVEVVDAVRVGEDWSRRLSSRA